VGNLGVEVGRVDKLVSFLVLYELLEGVWEMEDIYYAWSEFLQKLDCVLEFIWVCIDVIQDVVFEEC
jgi:hypothetical protein